MSRSIQTEDRISNLSDPILCHILSFLPTKFAVITSILSKRWNPLWLSVPTLHFENRSFQTYPNFRNFVSSVFLSRDITLPLQSFHLKCSEYSIDTGYEYDINRFIYAALQRGGGRLENFILNMSNMLDLKIQLHPRVFSCKTLVVLRLNTISMDILSHVVVDLPRLKTLHLSIVLFQRVEYLSKFLLGCPVLEDLNINTLELTTPERLVLEENIQCLTNLIRANISNTDYGLADDLFTLCCKAEVLYTEVDLAVEMSYRNTRYRELPMYHNLIYLEIIHRNNHCEKWNRMLELLKHCPKLQNLTIEDYGHRNNVLDNLIDPIIVPECLSRQLKTCLLKSYRITECEIQFAIYIMQNAKVLNTMSVKSICSIDINVKCQMITKLATPARASTTCKLLLDL